MIQRTRTIECYILSFNKYKYSTAVLLGEPWNLKQKIMGV